MSNYKYKETIHPITCDPMWIVDDISLSAGGIPELIQEFVDAYNHPNYSLSIYDTRTERTVEIDCRISEFAKIVEYVYHAEKGTPLTFIGVNSMSDSYVVGMAFTRQKIRPGCYTIENGELKRIF